MAENDSKQQQQETPKPEEPKPESAETPKPEEPKTDDVLDSHGQKGINLERHNREMAEKDAQIAELKAKLDDAAKTEKARAELKGEIDALKASFDDERVSYRLEIAGCKSAKAAKALLADYENDIDKLKAGEPWLFGSETKGATGLKPSGAQSSDELDEMRKSIGLKKRG